VVTVGKGLSEEVLLAAPDPPFLKPLESLRPPSGPRTIVVDVSGPIARAAVPDLCEHLRLRLAKGDVDLVTCEVGGLVNPDVTAVGALARLQLTARRSGRTIRLRNAQVELCDLLTLTGLRDELPVCPGLLAQPYRQPEQREQVRIDEEVDPADPSV
jgi:ABC-type transporter Mla MlaB component